MFAFLASVGAFLASIATQGCILILADEPKMPSSMIEE